MTARSAGDNRRRCSIQINTCDGDPVSRGFVCFSRIEIAMPNWDANLSQDVLSDDTNQALTLGLWMQWPGGPVDLKTYWPPQKLTGPP